MKKFIKVIIAISVFAGTTTTTYAELSASMGFLSDYVFRGVQTATGSAYGSFEYNEAGFKTGVWAVDLDDIGLEVDLYLGYSKQYREDGFVWRIGYTRYEYTDNQANGDLAQNEISVDVGGVGFNVQYTYGMNDQSTLSEGDGGGVTDDQDYNVWTLSYTHKENGILLGFFDANDVDNSHSGEAEYYWVEAAKSIEMSGFNIGTTVGVQFGAEEDSVDADSNDGYITVGISKDFDL